MKKILIADDELSIRKSLYNTFKHTYQVDTAENGREAVEKVKEEHYSIIILDQKMPVMDGITALENIKTIDDRAAVIMLTAYGSIESSVKAVKVGAYDYMQKPYEMEALKLAVRRAVQFQELNDEVVCLRTAVEECYGLGNLIGKSKKMQKIFREIREIAPSDVNVLILGESGTGKELVAKAIHYNSLRKARRLITVNCAAVPDYLMENELFGHEKGAFTGADKKMTGKAEEAQLGTLFLDEIGDLSLKTQPKLLRFLQDRTIERLGGSGQIQLDVRFIAATNQDLESAMEEGTFRRDLFYRLKTVSLELPALRERTEDIPLLAEHFLTKYSRVHKKGLCFISPEAASHLINYPWPGNVRELEKVVERAVILSKSETLTPELLPEEIKHETGCGRIQNGSHCTMTEAVEQLEAKMITQALEETGGNRKDTAAALGISLRSLQYKIKKYFT